MKGLKVVQGSINLWGILRRFFILVILFAVINESGGKESLDKNLQGIKNGLETVAAAPSESKASNIKETGDDSRKNHENSPALNSFLRNVLQARDELEWIDEAVRRVGNKEAQGKPPRFSPEFSQNTNSRYLSKTRLKRRSGTELDEFESWPSSSKRKYHDEENAGSRHQVYLDDEEAEGGEGDEEEGNEEMKVKRYAIPSDFDGEPLSPNSRRKQGRSSLDYRSSPAVDDLTLKRWARKEGLKVPGSWLKYEDRQGRGEKINRMNDWENSSRENRLVLGEAQKNNLVDSASEQPTLESLKRTVLELSRSLADSDRKMEELSERNAMNRERHVEDLTGKKEGPTKGEHERAMPTFGGSAEDRKKKMSGLDLSASSSNWWEDPRSAAEMFDFERRDDDETNDEDDDEDSEAGNSKFDYMMQRVKRAEDEDRGARVKVYRRAGFGGSYPEAGERGESYERRKRSRSEKDVEETAIAKNLETGVNAPVSGSYGAGVGEIREAGLDKIINAENLDGEVGVRAGIAEVNVNENEHNSGAEDKGINKREEEEKDGGGYNPVEKGAEGGTIGDSNLEDVKTASLSVDEKRSPFLRGREEKHEPRLSVAPLAGETPLDESSSNSIKSGLDGLLKNAAIEPPCEKIANEKFGQDVQGGNIEERSVQDVEEIAEQIGKEIDDKISQDSNESKKDEEPNRKNMWPESKDAEKFTDNIPQGLGEPKESRDEKNEVAIVNKEETNAAKEGVSVSEVKTEEKRDGSEEGKPKFEELANPSGDKESESADKLEADAKLGNGEKYENTKVEEAKIKREGSNRKLLWLPSEFKDQTEIRDGRRDSEWDQKDGGKTDQRPANLLRHSSEGLKFAKRFLMMADHRSMGNIAVHRRRKRRKVTRNGSKRSAKSYPENMEDDNAMEEVAREDKEDVHRSEPRKRSLKTPLEYRREPEVVEELYEMKDEGSPQINEAIDDPGVSEEDGENTAMESESQAESSPLAGSSHRDEDRDPIRDRINMLIKQKLDDRGKGKQAHLKREVGVDAANMEYYDYEGDVNGRESEVGSPGSDNEQLQNGTNQETSATGASDSSSESSESSASSTESSEPLVKKDEIADEEKKQTLEHEEMNNRAPKQEFMPDTYGTTTQNKFTQESESKSKMSEESSDGDQNRSKDEEIKNILRGAESSDENNERRNNEATNSNYNQWLAQPLEAAPEEQDTRKDRFQDNGESRDRSRPVEHEKNAGLEEPFEYSVNVHGKVDSDSIDDVLKEKPNSKDGEEDVKDPEKSEKWMTYDERNRDNSRENQRSNDELFASDDHWKYEGIRDKTRSQDDQKIDDEELGDDRAARPLIEKVSRRHWPYKNSARIEEENNAQESPLDSFSRNSDDQEETLENKNAPKETAERDFASPREARLIDESAEDSLPTMLDRSGPRNLAPGEGTDSVIPSVSDVESPRKTAGDNSSSSSSGSNYLALKTTDDLFKGGIEQSNPADEKITEPDIMRKTTAEWRMGDDPGAKPVTGRYPSSPLSALPENEEMVRSDPNSQYKFSEVGYQELGLNPRDVVHESIVDPEEMAADFDDDLVPRLGRSLQSVSYPSDPFRGVEGTINGERPAEKYLENTQIGFKLGGGSGHRLRKREAGNSNEPRSGGHLEDEDSEKKIAKENSSANEEPNLAKMNDGVDESKGVQRRSLESETLLDHRSDDREVDKGKRGLTNVEEWEMNAPNVQKQRTMTRSVEKRAGDLSKDGGNDSEVDLIQGLQGSEKSDADFKTGDKLSPDLKSHERETRSINTKNANVKRYASPFDTRNKKESGRSLPGHRTRSKIRSKAKFQSNLNPFESSWDSNFQDGLRRGLDEIGDDSVEYFTRNKRRNVSNKRSESGQKKAKLNAKETPNRKRRPAQSNYASSKREEFWHPQHGHRKKTVSESGTNNKHSSRELKKHRDGHGSRGSSSSEKVHRKRAKDQKERARFKDALREGHAKSNHDMTENAAERSHGSFDNFFGAPKAFDSRMEHGGAGRVLDESAEDGGNPVGQSDNEAEKNDQKKKFKVLLAADNMEDESQMDLALHGELAGKIVERIFDQVQKNDALKVALGPGLFRKHKSEDAVESDKNYRQGLDEDEVKHTEAMMRRVMELLGRLVLDEVQRKTCASLPPDMREFLRWMLEVEDEERSSDQAPPLPLVHSQDTNHRQDDKFLFGGPLDRNENADLDELNKKVRLLKGLINEYSSLTSKEKTKVQTVHDYLVKQLELLMNYIETKEASGNKEENVGLQGGNILQYQNAMPNMNGSSAPQSTLSPLVNTPSLLMLSNASFNIDRDRSVIPYYSRFRRREARSSDHGVEKRTKKPKKHRKHRPQKHKHRNKDKHKHEKEAGEESPQYKKLIRKAASLRKKRAGLFEDDWDPVNSGYEEPAIYTSSGELANGVTKHRKSLSRDGKAPTDYDETSNPYFWADVLSGKSNGDEGLNDNYEKLASLNKSPAFEEHHRKEAERMKSPQSHGLPNSVEERSMNGLALSRQQVKRDVLSASMALQPWINPKSNDLVSAKYLSKLTDELVHGVPIPPIYSAIHDGKNDKNNAKVKKSRGSSRSRNLADQEVMLLSKREAWKAENEQQLEEVAFGKDMRGKWKEEERFKKLTEMDKKKSVDDATRREKRAGEIEGQLFGDTWSGKSMNEGKTVDGSSENRKENEGSEATAAPREKNGAVNGGEDFEATGEEEASLISENLNGNSSETIGSGKFIEKNKVPGTLEEQKPVSVNIKSIDSVPDPEEGRKRRKDEARNESTRIVSPFGKRESEPSKETKEKDRGSKKEKESSSQGVEVSHLVLPWEKKSKTTEDNDKESNSLRSRSASNVPIEKCNAKRKSSLAKEEIEESAILPLLEISEQRQQQKQASKAEKDDQRDIADQTLGIESPLTMGLNTY